MKSACVRDGVRERLCERAACVPKPPTSPGTWMQHAAPPPLPARTPRPSPQSPQAHKMACSDAWRAPSSCLVALLQRLSTQKDRSPLGRAPATYPATRVLRVAVSAPALHRVKGSPPACERELRGPKACGHNQHPTALRIRAPSCVHAVLSPHRATQELNLER